MVVTGNSFDKYRSGNPIHRALMKNFLRAVNACIDRTAPLSILEVGCGPGDLATAILQKRTNILYNGIDIGEREIAIARERNPSHDFQVAVAEKLPYADHSFDLVIACEVLEHLEDPARALAEMKRVSKKEILISVPWEPWWRILNMMRGAYIRDLGNSPGHLQHFSRRSIRRLVSQFGTIQEEHHPFPWTVLRARL